jgi:predicted nucleic acid-binding protein
MILVDTSVWVNHFRRRDAALAKLLLDGLAGTHPFVIGELACGAQQDRGRTLLFLRKLPQTPTATEAEVHHLLDSHKLWGTGPGWIDLHLLTAALLSGWSLWTADLAMSRAAAKLGIVQP